MSEEENGLASDRRRARALRSQGRLYWEIADELGISRTTAYRWVNPDHEERSRKTSWIWKQQHRAANRARDRDYLRTHRGACSICGGDMHRAADGGVCRCCRRTGYDEKVRWVEQLWNEGKTYPELCLATGWSKGTLGAMVHQGRMDGYDFPHRYNMKADEEDA